MQKQTVCEAFNVHHPLGDQKLRPTSMSLTPENVRLRSLYISCREPFRLWPAQSDTETRQGQANTLACARIVLYMSSCSSCTTSANISATAQYCKLSVATIFGLPSAYAKAGLTNQSFSILHK